jgi:hypothetical protein
MTQFQSAIQLQQREVFDAEVAAMRAAAGSSLEIPELDPPPLDTYNATELTAPVSVTTQYGPVVALPEDFVFVNEEDAADQFVVHKDDLGTVWIAVE